MRYKFALVLAVFIFIIVSCSFAQKIKRYVDFPKHASDPSAFLNMRKSDSVDLNFTFKFQKQSNLPLMHKASRILAKKIVEKTVATPTISAEELWERRLKNLKNLDNEAEEYLDLPVLSSETVEITSKENNKEIEQIKLTKQTKTDKQTEKNELASESQILTNSKNEDEIKDKNGRTEKEDTENE